jgi:hypothetical protein
MNYPTRYRQPVLLGSRRSPLQGALIQPTHFSQETEGWDRQGGTFGWNAPVTAEPFGAAMHPDRFSYDQEGLVSRGLGADQVASGSGVNYLKWALIIGAAYLVYREVKNTKTALGEE